MTIDPKPKRSIQLLEVLRDQPFLSREQVELHLDWRKRTAQWHLERLRERKLVCMLNGRLPEITARSLWVLTHRGLERLAENHISLEAYLEKYCYHHARLERLVLVLDRVYLVRSFLLQLKNAKWDWNVTDWDVEVELPFWTNGYDISAPVDGIARLKNTNGQWRTLVIEYDTGRAPVKSAKPRLARFVAGMQDERFWGQIETRFPSWVIIAATQERLNDYHLLLTQLIAITFDLPRSFLTTQDKLIQVYQNPSAPVWETEFKDIANVPLLYKVQGDAVPPSKYMPWSPLPHPRSFSDKAIELMPLSPNEAVKRSLRQLAAVSLALYSLDKELLALAGRYPLLSASEMAYIKQIPDRSIRRSIERLLRRELVEEHSAPQRVQKSMRKQPRAERQIAKAHCYGLSEKGLWLITAWAGFGLAVEEYAKARGWKRRFAELVYHWEHTRIENEIFLQLLCEARKRGHQLRFWLSELESRLYFDYEPSSTMPFRSRLHKSGRPKDGIRAAPFGEWAQSIGVATRESFSSALAQRGQMLQSFLPDSRGIYATEDQDYSIAVEVDRSKANWQKMWSKFGYYEHALFRDDPDRWRILIVTTGWKRARNIGRLVVRYALSEFSFREFKHLHGAKLMASLKGADKFDSFVRKMLPVYVTTIEAIHKQGVGSRIWIDARDIITHKPSAMKYFLECLDPGKGLNNSQ